jgi:hypothetical protein
MSFDGGSIEIGVAANFDNRGFERYNKAVKIASSHKDVSTDLRADVDERGFRKYDSEHDRVEKKAKRGLFTKGGLDFDGSGFDKYNRGADSADRSSGRLRTSFGRVGGASAGLVTSLGAAGLGLFGLGAGITGVFNAYKESERVGNQTNAVIKSTGGAANVSAKEVGDLATALSRKTGVDDEAIQSGANLLLTFTGIRNEAGKGNDIFNQTTQAALDMSVAMGTDAKSAAMTLGKALNDPAAGMTKLTKQGVTFTDQQKEQIKALQASGDTMGAQRIILGELNKEFGGSAEATATWSSRLKVTAGNVAESLGQKVSPALEKGAEYLDGFVNSLMDGSAGNSKFGRTLAPVVDTVKSTVSWLRDATGAVIGFFRSVASDNSGTINKIFNNVKDTLSAIVSGAGRVRNAIKTAFSGKTGGDTVRDLRQIASTILSLIGTITSLMKAVTVRAIPGIVKAFKGLAQIVRGVVQVISGILTGDFGKAWEGVKNIFSGGTKAIMGVLRAATAPFREVSSRLFGVFKSAASGAWTFVSKVFNGGMDKILGGVSSVMGAIADVAEKASKIPLIGGKFKGLAQDIRGTQKRIDDYRESLRSSEKQQDKTGKSTKDLRAEVNTYKSRLGSLDKGTDEYKQTAAKLQTKQRALSKAMADSKADAKKGETGVRGLGDGASSASGVVGKAAQSIAENISAVAKGLSIKAPTFNIKLGAGAGIGASVGGTAGKFAGGGIPNPGSGSRDDHILFDPSGRPVAAMSGTEGILNTPQMHEVHHALQVAHAVGESRFGGLDHLWNSGGMTHYATGGRLVTASEFGGHDDPSAFGHSTASGAIANDSLFGFAELSHPGTLDFSAMGHLPMGTRVKVTYKGRTIEPPKVDVGAGGPPIPPADSRAIDLTYAAARKLGISGLANVTIGGPGGVAATGSSRGSSGGGASDITGPTITGPAGILKDLASKSAKVMTDNANKWIQSKSPVVDAVATPGGISASGPSGVGTYNGIPMANWVIGALNHAKTKGVNPTPTSGYRPGFDRHTASGNSEHQGKQYPHGAVDFGSFTTGLGMKMSVVNATKDYKYPLLAPIGFSDDGHASGTGHARGGLLKRATGGLLKRFAAGGKIETSPTKTARSATRSTWVNPSTHAHSSKPGAGQHAASFTRFAPKSLHSGDTDMRGFAIGGMLPHFATGGSVGKAIGKSISTRSSGVKSAYASAKSSRRINSKRVVEFDKLTTENDNNQKLYAQKDREFGLSDEELINDKGEVDKGAVNRRWSELTKLYQIRKSFLLRLYEMRKIAARVIKTYKTIIGRLSASLKHAKKKERGGVQKSIASYNEALGEWTGKKSDIGWDIGDTKLDLKEISGERAAVLGTKAEPAETDDPETPDAPDAPDPPSTDTPDTPDAPDGPSEPVQTPAQIAEAFAQSVAAEFASFNENRADLFSQFGSNFTTAGARQAVDDTVAAAGARFYGATTSGDEGAAAGRARDAPLLVQHYNVQTMPEPLTWAADTKYTIDSLVGG